MHTWTICASAAALVLAGCGGDTKEQPARPPPVSPPAETWDLSQLPDPGPVVSARTTPEGVRILVLAEGEGEPAADDTMMDVNYIGYLRTGEIFDQGVLPVGGRDRVPRSGLIPGWRQGLTGMKPKERRRVLIPAAQAYGWESPHPRMPKAADLVYDLRWSPFEMFDEQVGDGEVAKEGHVITVHYIGRVATGRVFEDSRKVRDREPVSMQLKGGAGGVIDGWVRGIPGMRVGGRRRLAIPSHLAYRAKGNPQVGIPPNTDLIFTVELLAVRDPMAGPK